MNFTIGRGKKDRKLLIETMVVVSVLIVFSAFFQLYPPAHVIGTANTLINISEIDVPLPEGAIPALYNPKFITAANATYPEDKDMVIGINYNGVVKAYPVKMMNWHEVVNDYFNSKPVVITYCSLCRTAIAFDRRVLGKSLTFAASGLLYNSNTIMVDNETRSYWIQMTGRSFMGGMIGDTLSVIPTDVTTWALWKQKYPNTLVMLSDTGFDRDYGYDPYGGYEESVAIWYDVQHNDSRLFTKDIVYGITFGVYSKAYPKTNVTSAGVINDVIGSEKVVILYDSELDSVRAFSSVLRSNELTFELVNGKITDKETKSVWNVDGEAIAGPLISEKLKRVDATYGFWFVWAAFYPKTDLYKI
ncbi:MAG: DUF3179 domain-containing protein [Candidatus Aenigmatarchaeota archaeon]